MRRSILTLALILAACGGDPVPGPDNRSDVGAETVPAPSPTAATASTTVPVRFVGRWDRDAAACRAVDRGEMQLDVSPDALRFWESEGRVASVTEAGDGGVDVDAVLSGEGVTEQRRYRLTLGQGGTLEVTAGGATVRRVRCDAPAGAREAAADVALNLSGGGIQLVRGATARIVPFGTPAATVSQAVEAATRSLPERGTNAECGAGPLAHATYPGIRLWFQDDRFVGWDARGRRLTTMAGVGVGVARAQVEDVMVADVRETSLGTEFTIGDLSGLYEGDRVSALWAGVTCAAR